MTKRRRKRKKRVNKQPKSRTMLSPSTKTVESTSLPSGVAKLEPGRTVLTSKEILVEASVESCFDTLSRQLEQPPEWDSTIVNAWPVSDVRGRIGATSQVTLNLGGRKLASMAMISRYHLNRAISWVLTSRPKVREDWQLEAKPCGTMVQVTLAQEIDGLAIKRFIYKIIRLKQVEQDLDRTLAQLKAVTETILS